MFHVTCYGWLMFRAQSFGSDRRVSRARCSRTSSRRTELDSLPIARLCWSSRSLLAVPSVGRRAQRDLLPLEWPSPGADAAVRGRAHLVLLFGDFEGAQFIYFQF